MIARRQRRSANGIPLAKIEYNRHPTHHRVSASAIALARLYPISEPLLGTEWQSSRVKLVITYNHG
jgi:hypothetical protein